MIETLKSWLGLAEQLPMPTVKPADTTQRSPQWARVRAEHLRIEPACLACGYTGKKYIEVHHRIPFHVDPSLELQKENLKTLCESPGRNCHFCFGHAYNWKWWNLHVEEDARLFRLRMRESNELYQGHGRKSVG